MRQEQMATYILIDCPTDPKVTILLGNWVWDGKVSNKYETTKFKARWAVYPTCRNLVIHFDKTYAIVGSVPTSRAFIALCAHA